MSQLNCACNGKKCEGICRDTNLNRLRTGPLTGKQCPAAYWSTPPKKRRTRYQEEEGIDIESRFESLSKRSRKGR